LQAKVDRSVLVEIYAKSMQSVSGSAPLLDQVTQPLQKYKDSTEDSQIQNREGKVDTGSCVSWVRCGFSYHAGSHAFDWFTAECKQEEPFIAGVYRRASSKEDNLISE